MRSLWQRIRTLGRSTKDPVLEALLKLARAENAENRSEFYQKLARAMLYIATTSPVAPDKKQQNSEHSLSLRINKDESGAMILPAFTTQEHFLKWYPQGSPYVGLSGQSLMELFLRQKTDLLAINPAGPIWCTLSKNQIREALQLAGGSLPPVAPSRTGQSRSRSKPAGPEPRAKHPRSAPRKKKKQGS